VEQPAETVTKTEEKKLEKAKQPIDGKTPLGKLILELDLLK